jgi:hypothetical protein
MAGDRHRPPDEQKATPLALPGKLAEPSRALPRGDYSVIVPATEGS